jgi:hypothetical protein
MSSLMRSLIYLAIVMAAASCLNLAIVVIIL